MAPFSMGAQRPFFSKSPNRSKKQVQASVVGDDFGIGIVQGLKTLPQGFVEGFHILKDSRRLATTRTMGTMVLSELMG
jgi:Cu/Zn superoxide dismutase